MKHQYDFDTATAIGFLRLLGIHPVCPGHRILPVFSALHNLEPNYEKALEGNMGSQNLRTMQG